MVTIIAKYMPNKKNILVEQSHLDYVLPVEWIPLPQTFDAICEVGLFATGQMQSFLCMCL